MREMFFNKFSQVIIIHSNKLLFSLRKINYWFTFYRVHDSTECFPREISNLFLNGACEIVLRGQHV